MDKQKVISMIAQKHYHTVDDLRYNRKIGILFSRSDFEDFLSVKDQLVDEHSPFVEKLPLKTFNSKHCFFVNCEYLLSLQEEYLQLILSDAESNQRILFTRLYADLLLSRIFSEVEGSLRIENVPTTHKRISEIHQMKSPTEKNDIIVKNMLNGIDFITKNEPTFNKENLRKLYSILSMDCLEPDITMREDQYYRNDSVEVGGFKGAEHTIIEECMNSLFDFANDKAMRKKYSYLLPYICHYYILYIHPYFDYNGRTARMVSFWLSYIYNIPAAPLFMSEAINESKSEYYRALENTRNTHNDLTYFLGYIMKTAIRFSFVYKNLEEIKKELAKTGDALTSAEYVYIKKLLIHNPTSFFTLKQFIEYINMAMTKQGAQRILNNLEQCDILLKSQNKRGHTIYMLNPNMVTYQYTE